MKTFNFFLSIIKLPYTVICMTIALLVFLPHVPDFIKYIKEGGSFDIQLAKLFVQDRMAWVIKLGDTPELIQILLSALIWFWMFH